MAGHPKQHLNCKNFIYNAGSKLATIYMVHSYISYDIFTVTLFSIFFFLLSCLNFTMKIYLLLIIYLWEFKKKKCFIILLEYSEVFQVRPCYTTGILQVVGITLNLLYQSSTGANTSFQCLFFYVASG